MLFNKLKYDIISLSVSQKTDSFLLCFFLERPCSEVSLLRLLYKALEIVDFPMYCIRVCIMASFLVYIGRLMFFGLVIIQSISLASYPADYKDHSGFYGLIALSCHHSQRTNALKTLIKTHRKVLKTSILAYTMLLVQGRISQNI